MNNELIKKVSVLNDKEYFEFIHTIPVRCTKESIIISWLNFHALELSNENTNMHDAILNANYTFRDGVAIEILMRKLNLEPGINANGTDMIPLLLDSARDRLVPVILIGSVKKRVEKARDNLISQGHNVITSVDGYKDDSFYIEKIKEVDSSSIVLLGMGMPRQEILSMKLKKAIDCNHIYINGGAIIDRFSGEIERAPEILIKLKLEWLYRFIKEPLRLFDRTVLGGFRFARIFFGIDK